MWALLALLCFVVAQFERALGPVDLLLAGLAFLALHVFWPWTPWTGWRR